MKKNVLMLCCALWVMSTQAQPRPFEPDPTFMPTLEFMQKTWRGEYDGLEPNSRIILSLNRTLVLNADLTYTNEVMVQIKNQTEEVLLRYEKGTYHYDPDNPTITYSVEVDSTLDVNNLLKGEELTYTINHYKEEGTENTMEEEIQFTRASTEDGRQWILFDQQLMSPIDPRQRAVYVMTGEKIETASIVQLENNKQHSNNGYYDIKGYRILNANHGLYIVNRGKKLIK